MTAKTCPACGNQTDGQRCLSTPRTFTAQEFATLDPRFWTSDQYTQPACGWRNRAKLRKAVDRFVARLSA